MMTAWWELPATARYLRTNLMGHLLAAGRAGEAAALATDLRWAATRLDLDGPAAVSADLALAGTPQALRLGEQSGKLRTFSPRPPRRTHGSTSCSAGLTMTRTGGLRPALSPTPGTILA